MYPQSRGRATTQRVGSELLAARMLWEGFNKTLATSCADFRAGIYNVQEAVGMDHRPPKKKRVQKPNFDCPTVK